MYIYIYILYVPVDARQFQGSTRDSSLCESLYAHIYTY